MPPSAVVALSFLILILVGTGFLCIPAASSDGSVDFMTALFTATSASCVTGLSVVPTAGHWSYFGQAIILVLIQIGGLGFITIVSVFVLTFKHVSLSQRKLVMQSAGSVNLEGINTLVRYILIGTFSFEFIGAFLLCFSFVPRMGWGMGIWSAVFTAVSAFCNAGFTLTDIYGENSLCGYVSDPLVNIVICLLIIIGGIGFFVWGDVVRNKHRIKKYSFHSKVVLATTGTLILLGWALFMAFEWNNPLTIGNESAGTKVLASLFMSVSPRTAGFNTVDMAGLSGSGSVLTVIYMFIGGSPGSTAGGLKTTTLAVFLLSALATSRRHTETHIFCRKFEDDASAQAGVAVALYLVASVVSVLIIAAIEGATGLGVQQIVFEVVSAVGTVGLTCGLTSGLHIVSQLILIILMFIGRVGGFTLILIFSNEKKPVKISRVAERLIIG